MNLKHLSGNKSRRVSDATSKGIKLPNTNLWFYGTKWDINGNTVAVFSFDKNGGRKWSVQVNAYDAFRGLHLPSNSTPVDIINANSKESIEKAVVKYINEFGTKMQKNGLFVEPNYVSDSRRVSDGANDEFLNQIKEDVENDKMDLDKAACELYQAGYFDELPFNRDVIELCNIDMNKYRWVGSMSKKLIEKPLEEAIRLLGDDWTLIEQYEGGFHDYYYKFVSGDIKESGDEEYITLITDGKYVIDVWTNMNDPWLVKTHRFNDSRKVSDSRKVKDAYSGVEREMFYINDAIDDNPNAQYLLRELFNKGRMYKLSEFLHTLDSYKITEGVEAEVQEFDKNEFSIYFYKDGKDYASVSGNVFINPEEDYLDKIADFLS